MNFVRFFFWHKNTQRGISTLRIILPQYAFFVNGLNRHQ